MLDLAVSTKPPAQKANFDSCAGKLQRNSGKNVKANCQNRCPFRHKLVSNIKRSSTFFKFGVGNKLVMLNSMMPSKLVFVSLYLQTNLKIKRFPTFLKFGIVSKSCWIQYFLLRFLWPSPNKVIIERVSIYFDRHSEQKYIPYHLYKRQKIILQMIKRIF